MKPAAALIASVFLMGLSEPGDELAGNSLEAVRSDGARAAAHFTSDRRVVFNGAFGADEFTASGTYTVRNGQLCFLLEGQSPDCWEYPGPLRVGSETTLRSADGELTARFRLLEGHIAQLPRANP